MLRYMLFDLDNTLYSDATGMERDTARRINEYVARYLGLSDHETRVLRHERARAYGTTLEWLMAEEDFSEFEDYFSFVHPEGEERCLSPDAALGRILDSIELPKAVFTNAPKEHAERVLAKLGIPDRFEAIYDIRYSRLKGKPRAEAFLRVCGACGVSPGDCLFVDDLPRYVRGFLEIGGKALLLDETGRHADSGLKRIRSLAELPGVLAEEASSASRSGAP
jgi:putative hydrolase of the HAD superfamily